MPRFNSPLSSQTLRSARSSSLTLLSHPEHAEISTLGLLTSPFHPDPTKLGPPLKSSQSLSPEVFPNDLNHPYPSIRPMTPSPSRPLTTASILHDCFIEPVIHSPHKREIPDQTERWGGPIHFLPIQVFENRGILGTPMLDCLHGFGLQDPQESLFENLASAGKSHIKLKIMWPGYPWLDWVVPISIYVSGSFLMTKRDFAHEIAVQYQNFALMCELTQVPCQDPRWFVGPGGYTFDRMRLSALYWVDEDMWQACIEVLTDQNVDPLGLIPMRDLSQHNRP